MVNTLSVQSSASVIHVFTVTSPPYFLSFTGCTRTFRTSRTCWSQRNARMYFSEHEHTQFCIIYVTKSKNIISVFIAKVISGLESHDKIAKIMLFQCN